VTRPRKRLCSTNSSESFPESCSNSAKRNSIHSSFDFQRYRGSNTNNPYELVDVNSNINPAVDSNLNRLSVSEHPQIETEDSQSPTSTVYSIHNDRFPSPQLEESEQRESDDSLLQDPLGYGPFESLVLPKSVRRPRRDGVDNQEERYSAVEVAGWVWNRIR
jgi:hypothetical protein